MMLVVGLSAGVTLAAIGALHVYWAFGGKLGGGAAVPERDGAPLFRPSRGATLLVAGALFTGAALLFAQSGVVAVGSPAMVVRVGCWGLAFVFAARAIGDFRWVGMFKRERRSRFARMDTRVFTPLCLVLAVACAVVAGG